MSRTTFATDISILPLTPEHAAACEAIRRALPDWFGIEEGLQELRLASESQPGFVATVGVDLVGFVTLEPHFPKSWEITWMAVHPDQRRSGIGKMLVEATLDGCRHAGVSFLLVKTLAATHPSQEYAQTRAFYLRMGFERLQILPDLWEPHNPCLLLARTVASAP